jgi:hypothetical protein
MQLLQEGGKVRNTGKLCIAGTANCNLAVLLVLHTSHSYEMSLVIIMRLTSIHNQVCKQSWSTSSYEFIANTKRRAHLL